MIYSIVASYPDAIYIPYNSHSPFYGVITSVSLQMRKVTMTEVVNRLFDGDHHAVFNSKPELVSEGDPEWIELTTRYN